MENKRASDIFEDLWRELLSELSIREKLKQLTPSLVVSKTRDYNRKWNALADKNLELAPDGFLHLAKIQWGLIDIFPEEYKTALKYL